MGLDQYIHKVGFNRVTNTWDFLNENEDLYFRKFYPLHDWIVKNCTTDSAEGVNKYGHTKNGFYTQEDNCVTIPLLKGDWEKLRDNLKVIIDKWDRLDENDIACLDSYDDKETITPLTQLFIDTAELRFPVATDRLCPAYEYGSSYMQDVKNLYHFSKLACGEAYESTGYIPGDPPLDEEKLRLLKEADEQWKDLGKQLNEFLESEIKNFSEQARWLSDLPVDQQASIMNEMEQWIEEHNFNPDYNAFMKLKSKEIKADDSLFDAYAYAYYAWY